MDLRTGGTLSRVEEAELRKIYNLIKETPGLKAYQLAKRCGYELASYIENKLIRIEEEIGLLS